MLERENSENNPHNKTEYFKELKKQRKKEDLNTLYQMLEAISIYESGELRLENVMQQISALSGGANGISFNSNYDKETYTIRNRYGFRQRNNGNKENPQQEGRINFEQLFKINVILKSGIEIPEELAKDISILKEKILYILHKEFKEETLLENEKITRIQNLGEQSGNTNDLDKVSHFVHEHYSKVVLNKIKYEVTQLDNFTFKGKDSIYYFARKMVVIGELCNELGQDLSGIKELAHLKKLFSLINNLRNGFVHYHTRILYHTSNANVEKTNTILQGFISTFKALLDENVLEQGDTSSKLKECLTAARKANDYLLRSSKYKLQYQLETEVLRAKQVLNILNSSEYKNLYSFCKEANISSQSSQIADILKNSENSGNISYLFQIERILTNKQNPLDTNTSNQINELLEALKKYIRNQNLETLSEQYRLLMEEEEYKVFFKEALDEEYYNFDINNIETVKQALKTILALKSDSQAAKEIISLLQQAINIHTKPTVSMPKLVDINKRYLSLKEECEKLEEENRSELLNRFRTNLTSSEKDNIDQLAENILYKVKKNNVLQDTIVKINKEMQYLHEIEKSNDISKVYRIAIIEHIITIIAECMRKIEEIAPVEQVLLSHVSTEAGIAAKIERSKGLAHEVLYFDSDRFERSLLNDIMPSKIDFQAIHTISKESEATSKTVMAFNSLGEAFARLCLYDEACEKFNQALEYIHSQPQKINEEKMKSSGIDTQNVHFIDLDEVMLGIDSYTFKIKFNLANIYLIQGKYKQAYTIAEEILDISLNNDLSFAADSYKDQLAILAGNAANCLLEQGNYYKAEKLFRKGIKLAKGKAIKESLSFELKNCMLELSRIGHTIDISEFNLICESEGMHPHTLFVNKFISFYTYINEMKFDAAQTILSEMPQIIGSNIGKLKDTLGDRHKLLKFYIIQAKINLSEANGSLDITYLQKLDKEFNDYLLKLRPNLQKDKTIGETLCHFCSAYSWLAEQSGNVILARKYLKTAEDYLIRSSQIILSENQDFLKAAKNLVIIYSNYQAKYLERNPKTSIEFLEKILAIQEKYGFKFNESITIFNLGCAYTNYGDELYTQKKYELALPFFQKGERLLLQSKRFMEENPSHELSINAYKENIKLLGVTNEGIGRCEKNCLRLSKAIAYYNTYLQFPNLSDEERGQIENFKYDCFKNIKIINNYPINISNMFHSQVKLLKANGEITKAEEMLKNFATEVMNIKQQDAEVPLKLLIDSYKELGFNFQAKIYQEILVRTLGNSRA